jgi:hypothetical protein
MEGGTAREVRQFTSQNFVDRRGFLSRIEDNFGFASFAWRRQDAWVG